jgi:hypothetical protein
MDDRAAADLVSRAEDMLRRVEQISDPDAREAAVELVRALLELYGEGLARLTAMASGAGGDDAAARLADDQLVSHLLLLHGLHPLDAPTRIARALEAVRPRLSGGHPELLDIEGARVRLRLSGPGGCHASAAADALREAVTAAAPEIEQVEVEEPAPEPALVPLDSVRVRA